MIPRKLKIWWLYRRIRRRHDILEDLKEYRAHAAGEHRDINLYMLDLRDRNHIDIARIATLTYLGEKNAKSQ